MVHLDSEEVTSCYNGRSESLLAKWDIPINHLEYEYIEKCTNDRELERIVRILRSGQEGIYPDLLAKAEARLASVKPSSKVLIKNEPALTKATLDSDTWNEVVNDLTEWSDEVTKVDSDLNENRYRKRNENLPEVRKANVTKNGETKDKNSNKSERIKSYDYAAWDKYDPDLELLKEDLAEQERKKEEAKKRAQMLKKKKSVSFVPTENLTETEILLFADRERNYGNECFKAGDYEEAKKYYSHSIQLRPTVAAYNNRCLTNYKLKKYASALEDSEQALKMEPKNIKALFRKAQIYNSTQNYRQAYETLENLISIEPDDTVAQNLMNEVQKKLPENNLKKYRLKINDGNFDQMSTREESSPKIVEIFDDDPKITEIVDDMPPPLINVGPSKVEIRKNVRENERKMEIPEIKEIPSILKKRDKNIEVASKYKQPTKTVMVSIPSTSKSRGPGVKLVEVPVSPDEITQHENKKLNFSQVKPAREVKKIVINQKKSEVQNQDCSSRKVVEVSARKTEEIRLQVNENPSKPLPKKPVKIDKGSCGEPSPNHIESRLITTPYEFTLEWQATRDDTTLEKRAVLLRNIPGNLLANVIGTKLDGPMLTDVLKCLELFFMNPSDIHLVKNILTQLIVIPRFEIVALFLEKSDKIVLKNVLDFLTQHNAELQSNVLKTYSALLV